jgi:hypothetical protein
MAAKSTVTRQYWAKLPGLPRTFLWSLCTQGWVEGSSSVILEEKGWVEHTLLDLLSDSAPSTSCSLGGSVYPEPVLGSPAHWLYQNTLATLSSFKEKVSK